MWKIFFEVRWEDLYTHISAFLNFVFFWVFLFFLKWEFIAIYLDCFWTSYSDVNSQDFCLLYNMMLDGSLLGFGWQRRVQVPMKRNCQVSVKLVSDRISLNVMSLFGLRWGSPIGRDLTGFGFLVIQAFKETEDWPWLHNPNNKTGD